MGARGTDINLQSKWPLSPSCEERLIGRIFRTAKMPTTVRLHIQRQANKDSRAHRETFDIPFQENMNVISALMEVRKNPVTKEGIEVQPPAWEAACLEEVCGSCTMNVNGVIRQACTALIEDVTDEKGDIFEVTLEPMKKFPLVRDLI